MKKIWVQDWMFLPKHARKILFLITLSRLSVENGYLENIIPVSLITFISPWKAVIFTTLLVLLKLYTTALSIKEETAKEVFHSMFSNWLQVMKYTSYLDWPWIFCHINPAKTWSQHNTYIFWLPCTPENQHRFHWKILQFKIFRKSDQRSKQGKEAAISSAEGGISLANGMSSVITI